MAAEFWRRAAVGFELLEDRFILARVGGERDEGVVFRGGADHRGTADVDLLDRLFDRHVGAGDGLLEGVEVHDDQLEAEDAVVGERLHVAGIVVAAEDTAVDLRMEGFDAAIHHLGEAGVVGDVADREASVGEVFAGAAGGEELDAGFNERLGEVEEAGLVADAEEGAFDGG